MKSLTHIWDVVRDFYAARHEPEHMRPLVEWYWRSLLSLCAVALGGILLYGFWNFIAVVRMLNAGDALTRSEAPEVLSKKDLIDFLQSFEDRKARFETVKKTATSPADPSR